jgi:hypothetical protein
MQVLFNEIHSFYEDCLDGNMQRQLSPISYQVSSCVFPFIGKSSSIEILSDAQTATSLQPFNVGY